MISNASLKDLQYILRKFQGFENFLMHIGIQHIFFGRFRLLLLGCCLADKHKTYEIFFLKAKQRKRPE